MDKQAIRERVWDDLEDSGVARFPFPPHDRIPNYAGAEEAAERLAATDAWAAAETVKSNPDAPQLPVRRRALRDGKTVFVAVPRLADEAPFRALDPDRIAASDDATVDDATTISGIDEHGRPVGPDELPHVDLIVSGSVAVTGDGVLASERQRTREGSGDERSEAAGARIGKGEGYSDLEFAVLSELGAVDADTTVATTVHERQVLDGPPGPAPPAAELPAPDAHDVPMDLVVTPERTIETGTDRDRADGTGHARPDGLDWDALEDDRIAEMPVLERLQPD